jgi:hypothetical protein
MQVATMLTTEGERILDATGTPPPWQQDSYLPAGCHSADCAKTWDGNEPVELGKSASVSNAARAFMVRTERRSPLPIPSFLYTGADPPPPVESHSDQISDYSAEGSLVPVTCCPDGAAIQRALFFHPLPSIYGAVIRI